MDDYQSEEAASGDPCFYYEIPGGLLDKDVVEITGFFYGEKIDIEVLADKYNNDGDITAMPLHFTLTKAGHWSAMTYSTTVPQKIQSGNTKASENFQIRIVALDSAFEVHLNGSQLCTQKHLVPLSQVTHISIDGDAEFTGVEFKDLVSETPVSGYSESNDPHEPEPIGITPGFTRLSENRRSSNRKPKPPVMVPTHGSFRSKPTLATTREEPNEYANAGEEMKINAVPAVAPVRATADAGFDPHTPSPGSITNRRSGSLKASIRDKFKIKRRSKDLNNTSANEYGSAEDVWFEQGGQELGADGAATFTAVGAASVPNLASQPDKKEKKHFGLHKGEKKSRSHSSLPDEEKKKHHGAFSFGKDKSKKEDKPEKKEKKSLFGKRSKHDKDVPAMGGAAVITEEPTINEYANPEQVQMKPTLSSLAGKSTSSRAGSHARGSYDVEKAEGRLSAQSGTYQRASGDFEYAGGVMLAKDDDNKKKKLKGDSPTLASNFMDGRPALKGSPEYFNYTDARQTVPLHLEGGITNTMPPIEHKTPTPVMMATPLMGGDHKKDKKEKKEKLKGSSPEIAEDLMDNGRAMSRDFDTYTGVYVTQPLTLNQDDILSVNPKGFSPVIGAKGSYDLRQTPEISQGKYKQRTDSWDDEPQIYQNTANTNVQHSQPPPVAGVGGAAVIVAPLGADHSKKDKKNVLKGSSADIASNLYDEEGSRALRSSSRDGYPYCGENGLNMPLKVDATNRDAQPIPYGITTPRYTPKGVNGRHSLDAEYSINPTMENAVHAAPNNSAMSKSATLPTSSAIGASTAGEVAAAGTLPVAGVVLRDKDGKEKPRKRDRFSEKIKKIFGRKKKDTSADKYGIAEGVGTESEMVEYRTSSQQSLDFDDEGANFTVTASPSEVCLYASQLRGNKHALSGNGSMRTMCSGGLFQVPLRLTSADIPTNISSSASMFVYGAAPGLQQRSDSIRSYSTISPGGSRRIYHRDSRHRPESASSWSSISPGGTRRHRRRSDFNRADSSRSWSTISPGGSRRIYHRTCMHRAESASSWSSISPHGTRRHRRRGDLNRSNSLDSLDTWSSVTPGGSRHHYHRSSRHRNESVSSWSSISPHGTRRHRRRSDLGKQSQQQPLYDDMINIQKQETNAVHAANPQPGASAHSSNSSIPSLYGRVVLVGQSPGFRSRIQSYRKRKDMPKDKTGHNGYNTGSNSSISSIASDRLPSNVVKLHGGEYALFENAGETIFEQRPVRQQDVYANTSNNYGQHY